MVANFTLTETQRSAIEKLGVVLLYLHGSVAAGTARANSDVDIAVLFETTPRDSISATTAVTEALRGLVPQREMDIAILNEANPLLKQIVASTGNLLYARTTDDALKFELRAMHDYEYSRHVVRLGQELILRNVSV